MTMGTKTKKTTKLIPPDGGWGWVVLLSALMVNFLIPGTVKSFGVLFPEYLQVFKATPTAASWMPALCYFLYSFLGPLSSVLSMKYSYRTVTLIGGTFAAVGMMLSYFANSVTYLYVSYGVMVGIGAGLSFPPTVYIVTAYFERLRGFANGLCISGSAIGTIVLPPFLQYLLNNYGYRGAVMIMGAITLNTWVCALLYHPVKQHLIRVPINEEKGVDNEALTLEETGCDDKGGGRVEPKHDDSLRSDLPNESYRIIGEDMPVMELGKLTLDDKLTNLSLIEDCAEKSIGGEMKLNESCTETVSNGMLNKSFRNSDVEMKDGGAINGKTNLNNADQNTSQISRNSSIRQSVRNDRFRISRQHSIVSEIGGTLPLSPRANVPGLFKNLFKTHKSNKKEGNKEEVKSDRSGKSSEEEEEEEEEFDGEIGGREDEDKKRFFDISVLKDPIYLVILISNSTSAISNTNFMILLPSYAISQGFDKNMSALLLSVVSAFDLIGRIGGSSLSDIDFIPKYYYFVCGLGTSGIALALLPMATSYTMLSFFCGLFGLSSGMYIGITTVILADMLGTEKLTSSYGISLFVNGVLQLIGPPICLAIYEEIGSYKPIFLAFGIILILGTALWAFLPIIKRKNRKDIESA